MNISFRQIRAFEAVARTASFTGAARQLHLTQSAVSMLVQQLEDELGLQLFDRGRSMIRLTEAGGELLPLARRILDDMREITDGASDLRALRKGFLRVVSPQIMACTWVAEVLSAFSQDHPEIGIRMADSIADDVVSHVRRGDAEIGIGPERPFGDDIVRSRLMDVPMRFVCAATHRLAARASVSWPELRDEHWISYSQDFSRFLARTLHDDGQDWPMNAVTEVGYLTTTLALVGNGLGVTVAPEYSRTFSGNFDVRFIALKGPAISREYFVYQRKGQALSPAGQVFLQRLRHQADGAGRPA